MPESNRSCRFCDYVWGVVGVTAGLVLIFMGSDLLSGGRLGRILSRNETTSDDD